MADSLGDRIKSYEKASSIKLPNRFPVILRLDGRAFHTYTRGCSKPFDKALMNAMDMTAKALCKEIQGAQIAYVQSDEISILIHNYKMYNTTPWFDNKIQKMVSVSAAIASTEMTMQSKEIFGEYKTAIFDARVFIVPERDVNNSFVWRQQDWTRNSVQMLARSHFSHKECTGKNNVKLQDMLHEININWNNLDTSLRRGRCIIKESYKIGDADRTRWIVDNNIPIFSQDCNYIEKYLKLEQG